MSFASAKKIDASKIPVIDLTPLRDRTDPITVAKALHAASKDLGFIYIKGHGIPEQVIENARENALAFFSSSDDLKEAVRVSKKHRGWLSKGGAKMKDGAKPDLKESFIWGHPKFNGDELDNHPLRGENLWPSQFPHMEDYSMTYYKYAHEVAHHLMRGFAIALDLPEDFFLRSASRPLSRASYVFYPSQSVEMEKNQFGVGPHTDFGVLTVLCQDCVGGLQVQDVNGTWLEAPPIEGTLIVNVADLLSRWTDGAYKSTPHRVINCSGKERLSIVLAFDPNPETRVDAKEVFGANYNSKYEPVTCGDYLIWRFNKAFSYRKVLS